jgi:hypothetical protein
VTTIKLYAVRNHEGRWFRSKGFGGYGNSWVDEIQKAKVYTRIGQARSRVTYFANAHNDIPAPQLVELAVTQVSLVDESERIEKVKERKRTEKQRKAVRLAKEKRLRAEKEFERAKAELERLSK